MDERKGMVSADRPADHRSDGRLTGKLADWPTGQPAGRPPDCPIRPRDGPADVERVDDIALGLGHLASVLVSHHGVQVPQRSGSENWCVP